MPYHQRPPKPRTSAGKKRGRPRRVPDSVSCVQMRARVTKDEHLQVIALFKQCDYANLSEFLRASIHVRLAPPRVEIRERPAQIDREALSQLRRHGGLLKNLLGVARSLQEVGAVPGLSREEIALRWSQLVTINQNTHQLLRRLQA
jgi:hypothetical protein